MKFDQAFVQSLKTGFPGLSKSTAYHLACLNQQYRLYLLNEHLPALDSQAAFDDYWETPISGIKIPAEPRLEFQLSSFLADPRWPGREAFETHIKNVLDQTMIEDELQELRRIYLQNVFLNGNVDTPDVRMQVIDPEWVWTLNPSWQSSVDPGQKIELLKLKHRYFFEIGWLRDPSGHNPVVRFQLNYASRPQMGLQELLDLDMAIPQGSEIFHRIRDVNPFLISYFYNCYRLRRNDVLKQLIWMDS
ncbi:MAG: hypothetical protein P4M08_10335 [Oligoflexia bacterium]|nr:hypothetical protein [Oligoflexia bacterium]